MAVDFLKHETGFRDFFIGWIGRNQIIAHGIAGVAMPFSGRYSGPDRPLGKLALQRTAMHLESASGG